VDQSADSRAIRRRFASSDPCTLKATCRFEQIQAAAAARSREAAAHHGLEFLGTERYNDVGHGLTHYFFAGVFGLADWAMIVASA
jgi:hypothetical protein